MLKELLQLKPWITFRKPTRISEVTYCSFSDASHPSERDYGQTGIIAGLKIVGQTGQPVVFHAIDWTSQKQNRVSYSSFGAEILAAAVADDRGYFYKTAINYLFPHVRTKHELVVDSRGLYETITTLHEAKEYRLRATVLRIRNSFESEELDSITWIPGTLNVADALTKRSVNLYDKLNVMCGTGIIDFNLDSGYSVDSKFWN